MGQRSIIHVTSLLQRTCEGTNPPTNLNDDYVNLNENLETNATQSLDHENVEERTNELQNERTECQNEVYDNPFIDLETNDTQSSDDENVREYEIQPYRKPVRAGKKTSIMIASWNTRGKKDSNHQSKWKSIARVMRLQGITVLAVQEARMKNEDAEKASEENPGIHFIINGRYSNKTGMLFVINLNKLNKDVKKFIIEHEIVTPDRAQMLKIKWGNDQEISILNVYVPNETEDKIEFLKEIEKYLKKRKEKEICVLGDFNCIEDEIDRSPAHKDQTRVTEQLKSTIKSKKLMDIWRLQNGSSRDFTFTGTKSMARIDRIYMTKELADVTYNMSIEPNYEISDHNLITAKIMAKNTPYYRTGMWKMNAEVLDDQEFKKATKTMLTDFKRWSEEYIRKETEIQDVNGIKNLREEGDPQTKWEMLKEKIRKEA